MFTLDSPHYNQSFQKLDDLIDDVVSSGTDPNYNILKNGKDTGETLYDLINV